MRRTYIGSASSVVSRQSSVPRRRGAATLAVTLLLGGIVVEIGLVGVLLVNFLSQSNLATRLSVEAYAAARSGIDDVFLRAVKNDYGGCAWSPSCTYPLPAATGNASVNVTVSCNPASCATPTVTSAGNAVGHHRTLEAVLEVDPFTKVVRLQSLQEKVL